MPGSSGDVGDDLGAGEVESYFRWIFWSGLSERWGAECELVESVP